MTICPSTAAKSSKNQIMSILFTFPSPFVYSTQVENHKDIKQKVLPKILQLAKEKQDDLLYDWSDRDNHPKVITNFKQATNELNFCLDESHYQDIIWTPLDKMFDILLSNDYSIDYSKSQPSQTSISTIWWNVYEKGAYAPIHTHGNGVGRISGLYILHSNEPNNTVFITDHTHSWTSTEDYKHTTDYIKEGSVLLFPSSVIHYTLPCLFDKVSISFNLVTTYAPQ